MSRTLTKYEETKIIGLRAQQIACGSKPLVDSKSLDPLVIARQELKEKKIQFILYRPYPHASSQKVIINDNDLKPSLSRFPSSSNGSQKKRVSEAIESSRNSDSLPSTTSTSVEELPITECTALSLPMTPEKNKKVKVI